MVKNRSQCRWKYFTSNFEQPPHASLWEAAFDIEHIKMLQTVDAAANRFP